MSKRSWWKNSLFWIRIQFNPGMWDWKPQLRYEKTKGTPLDYESEGDGLGYYLEFDFHWLFLNILLILDNGKW